MDRMSPSEGDDAGSIPARGTSSEIASQSSPPQETAKEPGEKHRRKPLSFGAGKARSESISGKRKLFVIQF